MYSSDERGIVRQVPLPATARDSSQLACIDYSDSFRVGIEPADPRTALEWAREIVEQAPAWFCASAPRVWFALGLRHQPPTSAQAVLGWPILHASPERVLLGATSRIGMPAELLVWRPEPSQLAFATLVQQDNLLARATCRAITAPHQRVVRHLLQRASVRG